MRYGAINNPLNPVVLEIKALAELGLDYLELCLDPPAAAPEKIKLDELKTALDEAGLTVQVGHLPTFVWLADIYASVREASVREVEKALDILAELDVPLATLHPGYLTGLLRFIPKKGKELAIETLERILELGRERNIGICLENMFPRTGHFYRPEEFAEIFQQFNDLYMTLDLGHAWIKAPADRISQMIAAGGDRIKHVHVSDNTGKEDEHLPIGVGRVDVRGGLAALKRQGYQGTITLEVFAPDRDFLAISLKKVKDIWAEV